MLISSRKDFVSADFMVAWEWMNWKEDIKSSFKFIKSKKKQTRYIHNLDLHFLIHSLNMPNMDTSLLENESKNELRSERNR